MTNWRESDHQRDDIGRFKDKGVGSSASHTNAEHSEHILFRNTTQKEAEAKYRNKLLDILGDNLEREEILYSTIDELENKIVKQGYHSKSQLNYLQQSCGAIQSFKQNYNDIKEANTKYADKYFHAKANCQAAQYGEKGVDIAQKLSNIREDTDLLKNKYKKKKDGTKMPKEERIEDYISDKFANLYGRQRGFQNPNASCKILVDKHRPNGLNDKY